MFAGAEILTYFRALSKSICKYMRSLFIISVLALMAGTMRAEGYQVNLQSARQNGMGHTGTGLNLGAASLHFNPGALSFMTADTEFSGGGTAIFSNNTFQKAGSDYVFESDNPVSTPFYLYGAKRFNERLVGGLSVTTPFGNSLVWGDDWDGRFLIQDIALKAIFVQPTVSYRLNEKWSVGAGLVFAYGDVLLNKALPVQGGEGDGQVELSGKTTSFGANAGIYFQASEALSLGLSYRSTVNMEMDEGEAKFTVPASLRGQFPNTTFSAAMPMPGSITFGAGWQVNERLLLAADVQHVLWSSYKDLNFEFEADEVPDSYNVRNYENTTIGRVGAEYLVSDLLTARLGFAYDPTPIPDGLLTPETPGANKPNVTSGLTLRPSSKLSVDAAFQFIWAEERSGGFDPANYYGTYNTNAVLLSIGLNYAF